MQAKSTHIAFSLLLTCCVALPLASCQNSSWHLAASKKGGTVELCLSNGDECPQAGGVSPSSISVYRWDNMHDNDLVWDAEPKNPITASDISGVFTYGVAPKDWINKLTPPALICGKAYLVNPGAHYFALKCDGTVVVFDDPHLEEFFRGKTPAEPEKIKSKGRPADKTHHPLARRWHNRWLESETSLGFKQPAPRESSPFSEWMTSHPQRVLRHSRWCLRASLTSC
jgi:hypothetical protein